MWPREVFYLGDKTLREKAEKALDQPGVYVLYLDDRPYYIGQTKAQTLFRRIRSHATRSNRSYYNFWNYFSAFVVPVESYIDEVEAILITSTPAENRATPKIKRLPIPKEISRVLASRRVIKIVSKDA